MSTQTHSIISPAILYWGTPVVLITSENEDGTSNIMPMSSAWWLGHSCMLGLNADCKTWNNIKRTGQCVLNLADDTMTEHVNALADTTGLDPVSSAKQSRNYKFIKDKWARARLSPEPSDFVRPPRIAQCPVQMECEVVQTTSLFPDLPDRVGLVFAIEVRVLRTHVVESLRMEGYPNRIDPNKWKPLFMMFQEFYGLRDGKAAPSVLGRVSEEKYRAFTKSDVKKNRGDDDDVEVVRRANASDS